MYLTNSGIYIVLSPVGDETCLFMEQRKYEFDYTHDKGRDDNVRISFEIPKSQAEKNPVCIPLYLLIPTSSAKIKTNEVLQWSNKSINLSQEGAKNP